MTEVTLRKIEEQIDPEKRLGRHVEHDPRSRDYPFTVTLAPPAFRRAHHRVYGGILNQGNLGSCTGNATAGAINTQGLHVYKSTALKEPIAVALYSRATELDNFPGKYPPDDTGSSGLAVAKAAQEKGYITKYQHAFGMTEALTALQLGPVITGVDWYEGFDHPDANGKVQIAGQVRGGHEFVIIGFEPFGTIDESLIFAQNSWGAGWGLHGRFSFTVKTWQALLDAQGDVTILLK